MEFKEISDLIKLIGKTNLIEFQMKDGDFELHLITDKHGKSSPKPAPVSVLNAPMPITAAGAGAPMSAQPIAAPVATSPVETTEEGSGASAQEESNLLEIRSPMVGTFYRSATPEKGPYVKVGDMIETGSVVCIVEAMKLFNEIESEISGKIVKVMVEDAAPVEYDQVLFLVEA